MQFIHQCRERFFRGGLAIVVAVLLLGQGQYAQAKDWVAWKVVGPFVVRAEFPLDSVGELLGQLGQLQQELTRYLGVPPAEEAIDIYLLADRESYRQYLSRYLPNVPFRQALYVRQRGKGMVFAYQSNDLAIDLRHECTHALLHAVLPVVPLWLDEGFAEYFEMAPSQRAYGHSHLGKVRWNAFFGAVPRIEELEAMGDMSEMGQGEYRDSWAWVHFMLYGSREAHSELVAYLADLRQSTPPGLLSQRLAQRVPDCRRRFAAHFKAWKR